MAKTTNHPQSVTQRGQRGQRVAVTTTTATTADTSKWTRAERETCARELLAKAARAPEDAVEDVWEAVEDVWGQYRELGQDALDRLTEAILGRMTQAEREAYARKLLAKACALEGEAWRVLSEDAKEEEIQDAVGSLWEEYRYLGQDALDQDGTKAKALLDWRGWEREEEGKCGMCGNVAGAGQDERGVCLDCQKHGRSKVVQS